MNQPITTIKRQSRENLLGKYTLPIAVYLLSMLITMLLGIPFGNMMRNSLIQMEPAQMLIAIVGEVIIMLLSFLLSAGLSKIHLNIARRSEIQFTDFLYPFKNHPDKFMGCRFLLFLICFACSFPGGFVLGIGTSDGSAAITAIGSLLLIVGMILIIIFSLGFSLTAFLLLDDPYGLKVLPAMKKSWKYMKKKKRKLFLLYLSFIGMLLLGILSFGIGLLWIEQHLEQSIAIFYLDVSAEHLEYRDVLENDPDHTKEQF